MLVVVVRDCGGRIVGYVDWCEGLGVRGWEGGRGFGVAVVDVWWLKGVLFLILRRTFGLGLQLGINGRRNSTWSLSS